MAAELSIDIYSAPLTSDLKLSRLKPGETGVIASVAAHIPVELRNRLLALGFVPGTSIRVVRRAPFMDPTEFELRGGRISLRKSESQHITMR